MTLDLPQDLEEQVLTRHRVGRAGHTGGLHTCAYPRYASIVRPLGGAGEAVDRPAARYSARFIEANRDRRVGTIFQARHSSIEYHLRQVPFRAGEWHRRLRFIRRLDLQA